MAKMLICYYSRSGHTQHMAEAVAEGARKVEGLQVQLKAVADVKVDELLSCDAILMGSLTYYGTMAAEMKKLLDESVSIHGKLTGKVGGAFASSALIGGGNETTVLDILKAMLVHGMIVQGTAKGDHYGPVAIGEPDERSKSGCAELGRRAGELAVRLHG